jgi:hypothetical protein
MMMPTLVVADVALQGGEEVPISIAIAIAIAV